jgi:prepilin-type N-terminal cleavage/methylation domain-containing protein
MIMENRPHRRSRAGFTLVEVLCTLMVLLVLLPVTMESISAASRIASLTRQKAEATALAQSQMDELLATQGVESLQGITGGQTGQTEGEETHRAITYHWKATFGQFDSGDFNQDNTVQQLDLTVSWVYQGYPQEIKLSTLVYTPDPNVTEELAQ